MTQPEETSKQAETTLGEELRRIRELRGLTLREVESITDISNPYLSQLETGKIEKPSPNYLYKLAEAYQVPYGLLMEKAGYVVKERKERKEPKVQSLLGAALATTSDLTPEEAAELARYLAFIRSERARGK
jgi:transcriptional regulator with XRE-family HTH domain